MSDIHLVKINKDNYEEAMRLTEQDDRYVSVLLSLAYAYVKPWDEALDPYVVMLEKNIIGFVYVSYTPHSDDNYWIGGLYIKTDYQHQGYGRQTILEMVNVIKKENPECVKVRLTVEPGNKRAIALYESMGFITEGDQNTYGEIRYYLPLLGVYVWNRLN